MRRGKLPFIPVGEFYTRHAEALALKLVGPAVGFERKIREPTINRPGLALSGFFVYFAGKRIQVLGNAESSYLKSLDEAEERARCFQLCAQHIPCIVISRSLPVPRGLVEAAAEHHIAILGIGSLIRGSSGIGKSECVLGLIERGHSLVSDDVTRFRAIEGRELVGTAPDLTRYHMEVR